MEWPWNAEELLAVPLEIVRNDKTLPPDLHHHSMWKNVCLLVLLLGVTESASAHPSPLNVQQNFDPCPQFPLSLWSLASQCTPRCPNHVANLSICWKGHFIEICQQQLIVYWTRPFQTGLESNIATCSLFQLCQEIWFEEIANIFWNTTCQKKYRIWIFKLVGMQRNQEEQCRMMW